jgi:hypothetical protein
VSGDFTAPGAEATAIKSWHCASTTLPALLALPFGNQFNFTIGVLPLKANGKSPQMGHVVEHRRIGFVQRPALVGKVAQGQ